jgi:hypothetical protein
VNISSNTIRILFCVFLTAMGSAADEWQSLFNGKDLTGWRANFYPSSWSVVDGTIQAHATTESSRLFYVATSPRESLFRCPRRHRASHSDGLSCGVSFGM